MAWARNRHAHSKKALEKQLDHIETEERAARARLEKEMTSLGFDLDRIHRSSRGLNDCFPDTHRNLTRRLSLPLSPLDSLPPTPRGALRRGSIPAIPQSSPAASSGVATPTGRSSTSRRFSAGDSKDTTGNEEIVSLSSSSMTLGAADQLGPVHKQHRGSKESVNINSNHSSKKTDMAASSTSPRRGSLNTATKKSGGLHSKDARPLSGKRYSLDSHVGKVGQDSGKDTPRPSQKLKPIASAKEDNENHNTTEVFVHKEDGGDQASVEVNDQESSGHSMFESNRHSRRRASEPEIGGHHLRELQQRAQEEHHSDHAHPHPGPENEAMKKVIQSQLPSDIVAEDDEEEEYEDENSETGAASNNNNSAKPKQANGAKRPEAKSAASAAQRDAKEGLQVGDDEKLLSRMKALKQRRKSDGDVLKFASSWKIKSQGATKVLRSKGVAALVKDDEAARRDRKSEAVWDAVRKCRYIRGYEPPDMRQPGDLGEFVFGHRMKSSTPET